MCLRLRHSPCTLASSQPSGIRAGVANGPSTTASVSRKEKFMRLHIHAPASEMHSLGLKPQSLFDTRIPAELDFTTGTKHSLPGQAEGAMQHARHLSRPPRQTGSTGDRPVCRHFAAWDLLNGRANASFGGNPGLCAGLTLRRPCGTTRPLLPRCHKPQKR